MRVVTVAQMRELEERTFAQGTSEDELQRRAARAIATTIAVQEEKMERGHTTAMVQQRRAIAEQRQTKGRAVALVGPGNNGRDAFLAVRDLLSEGWAAGVYLSTRHSVTAEELRELVHAGGQVWWHVDEAGELGVWSALAGATVAVDGLLGIGVRGRPRPPLDEIVLALNAYRQAHPEITVYAVDVPSGLDSDTGEASEVTVRADHTVVLGGAKRGLLDPAASRYTGRLHFAEIGVVEGPEYAAEILTESSVAPLYQARSPGAHKGTSGRVLVVAGSDRYLGAAHLSSAAAVRAGAGIVTLAAPRWLRNVVASSLPEITYLPLPDAGPAGDPATSAASIIERLDEYAALAIGPGLSLDGGVGELVERVLRARARQGPPAVVDADALNVLSQRPGWPEWIGPHVIMTPHPGELRRLAGSDHDDSEEPWEVAARLAQEWGVTLVAKGAITAIGARGQTWVLAAPNPALATGGTGDVLTGILAGLLARGLEPTAAARVGVWAHSVAGDRARTGSSGLAASDLLPWIPEALSALERSGAR